MPSDYTRGPSSWRRVPRLRTKPSTVDRRGRRDTGGGYERIRSWEHDPTQPGDGKTDVYVSHHRLLAVVACYPDDMAVGEILQHLDGKDVHHSAPEVEGERAIPWDNRPECLHVVDHGRHGTITQAEMRAWARDDRERAQATQQSALGTTDDCGRCDATAEATVGGEELCLDCAMARAEQTGETVEL